MELSSPMIEDALEKRRIQLNVRMFWPPVLFVVAALAVLAIWPRPPIAPETKGEESGTFQAKVDGLVAAVKAGGSAQAEFVNAELNGYLRSVAKQQKLASAGALIQPGSVTIRVIDQLGPLQVGNRAFGPMRVSAMLGPSSPTRMACAYPLTSWLAGRPRALAVCVSGICRCRVRSRNSSSSSLARSSSPGFGTRAFSHTSGI